jgi:hypothetical protein
MVYPVLIEESEPDQIMNKDDIVIQSVQGLGEQKRPAILICAFSAIDADKAHEPALLIGLRLLHHKLL